MSPASLTELPEWSNADPRELEAGGAIEGRELEVGREGARHRRVLPKHHIARAGCVRFGPSLAPIIRSAIPSPLMSPAALTERPDIVLPSATPAIKKPVVPIEGRELEVGREGARRGRVLPKHHVASTGVRRRSGRRLDAPMRRSAIPSPLMSPAALTERPEVSPAATPESLKPVVPSRDESSKAGREGARRRRVLPKHHVARAGAFAVRVGVRRPDNQVCYSVAVDVPGRAHRDARAFTGRHP